MRGLDVRLLFVLIFTRNSGVLFRSFFATLSNLTFVNRNTPIHIRLLLTLSFVAYKLHTGACALVKPFDLVES
jgi:hypothetical protein